jgi:2'-5' RNA ligase
MEATAPLRLFIAVHLPDEVRERIAEAQHALQRILPEASARWTRPEQFHLTLRFLGSVDAQEVPPIIEALRNVCRGFGPLQLRAANIGFFPRASSPRVIWVGLSDSHEHLPALHRAVQEATKTFSAQEVEPHFTGHVTLGRIKGIRRSEAEPLAKTTAGLAGSVFGDWLAREIHLMRSELSPTGARHTSLASIPLG